MVPGVIDPDPPVYIYIYIYVCLIKLRHTPPAIEREITSGGQWADFRAVPGTVASVFQGSGVTFLIWERGGANYSISDRPAHLKGACTDPPAKSRALAALQLEEPPVPAAG